jgi:phage repressor protein C with HTH and peptisase S24 domain
MKKRLLEIVDFMKLSVRSFEVACGLQRGNISNMTDESAIGSDKLSKIIDSFPFFNAEWILTGKGSMIKDNVDINSLKEGQDFKYITTVSCEPDSAGFPLYDVSASAGYGSFEEMIDRKKLVGNFIIPGFTNIDWMIYVAGSSMYPKYSSGDIIACRVLHESRFIQWGKVYVLATREQGVLVKRLRKCEDENYLTAVCDNPAYDSFDVPKDEILGIALVVGVIRLE